jgi:NADH-quinone oxidoreductase subunit E
LGVKDGGDISADGRYTVSRVECLGACDKAPMMQVNDDYHEGLTKESAIEILKGMR